MKRAHGIIIGSHILVAVIGWAFAQKDPVSGRANGSSTREMEAGHLAVRHEGRQIGRAARTVKEGSNLETFWNFLPDEKLSTKDRIEAQRRILKEWGRVDLEGAIKAMLAESWWSGTRTGGFNAQFAGPLASAFAEAFQSDPAGSWDQITSGEFGIGASMLRRAWYDAMRGEPLIIAGKLSEVPEGELAGVVGILGGADLSDAKVREGVIGMLKEMPEAKVSTREIMKFLPKVSSAEAEKNFEAMTDFSTRDGEIALFQYSQARFIGEKFEGLRSHDEGNVTEYRNVLEDLPQEVGGRFLYGLLAGSFSHQTAMGTKLRTLDLLNLMAEGGHWEQVKRAQNLVVVRQGFGLSAEERASWAATLPEREETVEVFEESIRPYISKNEGKALGWIEKTLEGTWRDRALLAYSTQMLGLNRRLHDSREAIEKIEDAEIRREAEENHAIYENAGL